MKTALETPAVAKQQVNAMMDEGLVRLLRELQSTAGPTMTRLVTAAVLQYLFFSPSGPDDRWMRAALALEEGKVSAGQVPIWLADKDREELGAEVDAAVDFLKKSGLSHAELRKNKALAELRSRYSAAVEPEHIWSEMLKLADDPIDAILLGWKRFKSGAWGIAISLDEDGVPHTAMSWRGRENRPGPPSESEVKGKD